jgi:AcrR family transcriptional regulator
MVVTTENQTKVIEALLRIAQENPKNKRITVTEVAKRAGMTRTSFYKYNFDDMESILTRMHDILDGEIYRGFNAIITGKIRDDQPLLKFLNDTVLPTLYDQRAWLKTIYTTNVDLGWERYLQDKYAPLIETYLDKIGKKLPIENHYIGLIVIKEFLALVSTWITDDNPEPASLFKEKFMGALQTSPYAFLSLGPS